MVYYERRHRRQDAGLHDALPTGAQLTGRAPFVIAGICFSACTDGALEEDRTEQTEFSATGNVGWVEFPCGMDVR